MGAEFLVIGVQFSLLITTITLFTAYILIAVASVLWSLGETVHRSYVKNHSAVKAASQRQLEHLRTAHYHSSGRKSRISTLVQ